MQLKPVYFWPGFGQVYSGIIGIIGPGGNPGKQRLRNKPVFFPIFP